MAKPGKILIEKPMGGMALDYTQSNSAAVEGAEKEYSKSTGIDLFKIGKIGHIGPAEIFNNGPTDGSSNVTSLPRGAVANITTTDPPIYFITGGLSGTAPAVVPVTSTTTVGTKHDITAHGGHNFTTIPTGTGFWGEDIIFYRSNLGNRVFFSWNDNTDGDVGSFDLSSTYDDDFMSTVPTGAAALTKNVPHRMVEVNKILYITNGQYLASYDGAATANGTFNVDAFDVGAGWVITDAKQFGDYIVMSCVQSGANLISYTYTGQPKVVLWKGIDSFADHIYPINDNYISALYVTDTIWAFTQGTNNTMKIQKFNGQSFTVVDEHHTSKVGTAPLPNALDFYKGMFVWLPGNALNGYVCSYGPLNSEVKGVHIPYIVSDGTNTASTAGGMLKNLDQARLWAGGLFDATYKIVNLTGAGGNATGVQFRTRLFQLPYKAKLTKATVYFSQFTTASSVTLKVFKNYAETTDTPSVNKTISNTTYPRAVTDKSVSVALNVPNTNAYYMTLTFDHAAVGDTPAIIRAIEVEYVVDDKV